MEAGSQALKADALDFLGDGVITWLGLVALGRAPRWRGRAALLQGLFLGLLGSSVLATTVWQLLEPAPPTPAAMGVLGAIGLVVNLGAAAVLLPHRGGDASARAVWLFSRNDALGNLAVVAAAALVALTGTHWPDAVVAFVIAGLFLQSSWTIIRRAQAELRALAGASS